jgi:hypothetical protein
MKPICNNDDEYEFNCTKIAYALEEIRLRTTFNATELAKPSMREVLLFVLQLFNTLPHYTPKPEKIIFNCVLGETVVKFVII